LDVCEAPSECHAAQLGGVTTRAVGCGETLDFANDVVSEPVWVVGLSQRLVSQAPPALATEAPAPARRCALLHQASTSVVRRAVRGLRTTITEVIASSSSSHGVPQRPPLRRHGASESTSGCPERLVATPRACSVLAVPPGFDGFLLAGLCGFVAPRNRPWGSPGFQPRADIRCRNIGEPRTRPSSQARHPSELFPPHLAARRHRVAWTPLLKSTRRVTTVPPLSLSARSVAKAARLAPASGV
jgi:hypothetical protein